MDSTPEQADASNESTANKYRDAVQAPIYSTRDYTTDTKPIPVAPTLQRHSNARDRIERRRVSRRTGFSDWVWIVAAGLIVAVTLVLSFGAFYLVQTSTADAAEIIPTADVADLLPTPVVAYREFDDNAGSNGREVLSLPDGSTIELVPWDGTSRFTMVLVGLDRREGETGLLYRTDTMMLVSLDPLTNSIGVLSIPRDLYVQVVGYSSLQRINSALVLGESQRRGYGPTLMMQTVQLNLGMRVNEYMAVDFQVFIDLVNAIDGITIDNPRTINDRTYPDLNYGYDPFYLPAGTHELDGYNALRYARTRHGDSDIQRAERQQQVLYAIRDQVLTNEMIPTLLTRAPELWISWQDNVSTGLSIEQIIQLALYARDVPLENITMDVIDYSYLQSYTTPGGASVLIPNRARLGNLMVDVFGPDYNQ